MLPLSSLGDSLKGLLQLPQGRNKLFRRIEV